VELAQGSRYKARLLRNVDARILELYTDLHVIHNVLEMQLTDGERRAYRKVEMILLLSIEYLENYDG